jgi:hypothetical protein
MAASTHSACACFRCCLGCHLVFQDKHEPLTENPRWRILLPRMGNGTRFHGQGATALDGSRSPREVQSQEVQRQISDSPTVEGPGQEQIALKRKDSYLLKRWDQPMMTGQGNCSARPSVSLFESAILADSLCNQNRLDFYAMKLAAVALVVILSADPSMARLSKNALPEQEPERILLLETHHAYVVVPTSRTCVSNNVAMSHLLIRFRARAAFFATCSGAAAAATCCLPTPQKVCRSPSPC